MLCNRSVLALVDGVKLWDMHRPLESDCEIQLLHFHDSDPYHSNRTFWRSCSLMLGSVLSRAFKDDIKVVLHSFPSPNGEFWIFEIFYGEIYKKTHFCFNLLRDVEIETKISHYILEWYSKIVAQGCCPIGTCIENLRTNILEHLPTYIVHFANGLSICINKF